jgi:hypothetical protein
MDVDYDWSEDVPVLHVDDFGNDDAPKPEPPTALILRLSFIFGESKFDATSSP